jgi:hypothetical protein
MSEEETPAAAAAPDTHGGHGLASAIYGQVVVTSVVAALEVHEQSPPGQTLFTVAATILVFWVAHVYADALASAADWRGALQMLSEERAMVFTALPTLVVLAVGALHVLTRVQAVVVSITIGVITLVVLGAIAAHRFEHSRWRVAITAAGGGAFGLAVVALKVLIH